MIPSMTFTSDQITGLFHGGSETLSVTTNGVQRYDFTDTTLRPHSNLSFDLGTGSNIWNNAYIENYNGNTLNLTSDGVGTNQLALYDGTGNGAITYLDSGFGGITQSLLLESNFLTIVFDSFNSCFYPFSSDIIDLGSATNIWRNTYTDTITCSSIGTSDHWYSKANASGQLAAAPAFSHSSNNDTGMYFSLDGSHTLAFSSAGTKRMDMNSTATTVYGTPFTAGTQPFAYFRNTATQSISNNTVTTVTFNTTVQNQGSTITNTSGSITFSVAGVYAVFAKVYWNANGTATGARSIFFTITSQNGAGAQPGRTQVEGLTANADFAQTTSACLVVATSDTLILNALQVSGGSQNIGNATGFGFNELQIIKIC